MIGWTRRPGRRSHPPPIGPPARVKGDAIVDAKKLFNLFDQRRKQAAKVNPGLRVTLTIGDAEGFPKARDYAYSAWDGRISEIVFAPKVLSAKMARVDALMRHELAHAILQNAGLEHTEAECDAVAEKVFGDPIYYDADDVQTLDAHAPGARRPRPAYLPTGETPAIKQNPSYCGNREFCCGKCANCPFR